MKIKLDENLPVELARELAQLGHEADTVVEEGLGGADDDRLWQACQQANRFLITQDLDFSDLRKFSAGSHAGILLLRLRNSSRRMLVERTLEIFRLESVESWSGVFVTASERKIRIIRK